MTVASVLTRIGWCTLVVFLALVGYFTVATGALVLIDDPIVATLVVDGVVALGVVVVRRARPRWLSYRPAPGSMGRASRFWDRVVLALALAFLAGQAAAVGLYGWVGSPQFDGSIEQRQASAGGLVLALTLVVAPVSEEAMLRGLVYPMLRTRTGVGASMTVTALAFALMHGNVVQVVSTIPLALVLALVYERTRSLWPAAALHAVFNLAAVLVPPELVGAFASPVPAALLVAAFATALWLLHRRVTPAPPASKSRRKERRWGDEPCR